MAWNEAPMGGTDVRYSSAGQLAGALPLPGMSSALKELSETVNESCHLAEAMKSSLGISSPEQAGEDAVILGRCHAWSIRQRTTTG